MPTGRDARLIADALNHEGLEAEICANAACLLESMTTAVGVVLIAEEALTREILGHVIERMEEQPVWSDLPLIVFSSKSGRPEALLRDLGSKINATVVERPMRIAMLISAVRGALRARQRQYQTRDLLQQLEQADKQKDLFLATLSHELRTPLNSIIGWIQILRSRTLEPAAVNRAIEVIERNAKGQAEMISDILFVSRIITGKLEIKREPIDVVEIVNSVLEIIKPSADAKSILLTVESNGYEAVPVEGDAERLRQVFLNLLVNAIKFTPEGGHVRVALRGSGTSVLVDVIDNGQGIKRQFLPYVFERFRQADSTYTRRIGGLGLGLAIVRHLVELHGGTVTADSQGKGRGSVFTVRLPVADTPRLMPASHANQVIEVSAETTSRVSGMRILLVEDDKDSRDMLEMALAIYGIEVESAESAAEALKKIQTAKPDVLVSDIGLPGEDGYDLIRKVRALPELEGGATPAIALTGYVSVQDRNLALEAGYQDHIPKPVDPNLLLSLLAKLHGDHMIRAA
jgi:signal transduction histidine kinase/ActR/RegA family two-component response regulator